MFGCGLLALSGCDSVGFTRPELVGLEVVQPAPSNGLRSEPAGPGITLLTSNRQVKQNVDDELQRPSFQTYRKLMHQAEIAIAMSES